MRPRGSSVTIASGSISERKRTQGNWASFIISLRRQPLPLMRSRTSVRYHHLVNSTTTLALEIRRQVDIEVKFRPGLESFERHIAEWGPATFVAALRDLTGTKIVPRSLTFIHQRTSGVENFRTFFGCPVRFGANRQCIAFSRNSLLVPIRTADKYLLNILKAFCEEAMGRRKTAATPTRAKVEAALIEFLPNGRPTLPQLRKP